MMDLLRRTFGETIEIQTKHAPDLSKVKADPGQLENVILNLAINARDAMPDGGVLAIETANAEIGDDFAITNPDFEPGPHVILVIHDTVTGIPEENIEHVFEPFFTTKGVGDGAARVSGHIAYRTVLRTAEVPEDMRWNAATLWAGPGTHLVHYPLRSWGLFNLVAVFHSERYVEGWNEPGDRDELMRRFAHVGLKPMSLVEKVVEWRMWVLCDREPIAEWSRGCVTLLGDAAHPMLQYFAQGACMAIEDAVCLADEVAAAEGDFAAAFIACQQARYLRTARVQLMARFLGEVYHAGDVRRELPNHVLGARTLEQSYEGLA